MINITFLNKLKDEGSLIIIEPSEEISISYSLKSDNCIKVAELAFDAGIYENSISEAYYSIYNSVMSLFYKCGIKCENHSAAVILVKELFNLKELYDIFSEFKKDRIDNQYYTPEIKKLEMTKDICNIKLKNAKDFNFHLRVYIRDLGLEEINRIRNKFNSLFQ
ncbi:MAG: HEPN domain-containing protein [Nanoarchaeota archaeon]